MRKSKIRILLEKAYKAGQESVSCMRMLDTGRAIYGDEDADGRMIDTIDKLLAKPITTKKP